MDKESNIINKENYNEFLMYTLEKMYPNYLKEKILSKIANDGLVINTKRQAKKIKDDTIIDVSTLESVNDKFNQILNLDSEYIFCKYIEEFEFDKSYRYSTIFHISNFEESNIAKLISENKMVLYKKGSSTLDLVGEKIVPTIKISAEETLIKFPYLVQPKFVDSKLEPIKYNVICRFDSNYEVLELRLDRIPNGYQYLKEFYTNTIEKTLFILKEFFNIKYASFDFKTIVEYIREIEPEDISIYAMEMRRNGKKAYLDSTSGEDTIIPILGELKEFMLNKNELFTIDENTKRIEEELNNFIGGIEVNSDLPSIKVTWPEQGIRVGIKHNYKDEEYSLLMFYDELLKTKEKMDYVRKYFIEYNRELERQTTIDTVPN
ncbi:hypothetical protein [Clostridioides difficile]|uniref:hypothetical protein n=1 Tax=Clostridioides difficile TaxID=1496 RepID=UPI001034C044|nr:hypothetical protein [Clostridioides difficile]